MFNLKGITKATWVRMVAMLLVWINLVSVAVFNFELLPFDEAAIYEGVSIFLTFAVTTWTAWKNNSVTKEAQMVDKKLEDIKERK